MKKFTSLLMAGLVALTVSAKAVQPQVVLNNNTNYEVRIDGQQYSTGTNTVQQLSLGNHTVEVYSVTGGGIFGIGKKRTLVSSSSFNLSYNDVYIDVTSNGYAQITERRTNGGYGNNGGYDPRNGGYGNNGSYDPRNGGYGNNNGNCNNNKGNNGRGHAYGKYKNKKQKGNRRENDDDDRYDNRNGSNGRYDNYNRH